MKKLNFILSISLLLVALQIQAQEEENYYKSEDPILQEKSNIVIYPEEKNTPEVTKRVEIRNPEEIRSEPKGEDSPEQSTYKLQYSTKPSISNPPVNSINRKPAIKEESSTSTVKPYTDPSASKNISEESVLTFNFLYLLFKNYMMEEDFN